MSTISVLIAISLALCPCAKADPVPEKRSWSDDQRPGKEPVHWREYLTTTELEMLENISQHPVISTCIAMADDNHAIASYKIRKLARFGVLIQHHMGNSDTLPDIELLSYQWPARAFRWCSKQAGITLSSDTTLLTHAYDMARIIFFPHNQPGMVAFNTSE